MAKIIFCSNVNILSTVRRYWYVINIYLHNQNIYSITLHKYIASSKDIISIHSMITPSLNKHLRSFSYKKYWFMSVTSYRNFCEFIDRIEMIYAVISSTDLLSSLKQICQLTLPIKLRRWCIKILVLHWYQINTI